MTPAELRSLVEDVVQEQLAELIGDPDEGLALRPEFLQLLKQRIARFENEGTTVSLEEAFSPFDAD